MAYAAKLVILVPGTFPSVMNEIMEGALGKVTYKTWTHRKSNQNRIDTTKTRVTDFVFVFGADVFSNTHSAARSYSFPEFASVFQAEILLILEICRWLGHDLDPKYNISILPDS